MKLRNRVTSGAGIGIAVTTVALSPRGRRLVHKSADSIVSKAIALGTVVVRGTRNLQEESKHVTRFGADPAEGDTSFNEVLSS